MIQATETTRATETTAGIGGVEIDASGTADRVGSRSAVSPLYGPVKRLLDLVGAAVGLVAAAPVLGAAAVAIKLDDGGPIIHRRRILGLGGRELDAFKLRTMRVDADAWLAQHPELLAEYRKNIKLHDDPRITRVGRILRKLSIDELPQLVNVLRGEMSLVGPRMIHPSELERFGSFGARRLTVKPGVTGLWQVSGRQSVDYDERVALDRRYLETRSLLGDISILLRTVPAVLFGRGAH
jgi:lipopolysaccharide/colanic/teichoic acid biosynthesis glycosyltransferase